MLDKLEKYFALPDFKKIDFVFLGLFSFLCLFGLLAVATASIEFSDSLTGDPLYFTKKQSVESQINDIMA